MVKALAADLRQAGRRSSLRLAAAVLLACITWLSPQLAIERAFGADLAPPVMTAWQRTHEAHLTIAWPKTVRVQQKRNGDRLVLRFGEPLNAPLSSVLQNLSTFVDSSRSSVQGRDLTLALHAGVSSQVGLHEKRIVTVDFVRDPSVARLAEIEVSALENGVRLIFSWPGPTGVRAEETGDQLLLAIAPGWDVDPADLARVQTSLQPWLSGIGLDKAQDSATLSLALGPQIASGVQSVGPDKTVVDLVREALSSEAPTIERTTEVFIPERKPDRLESAGDTRHTTPPIPQRRPVLTVERKVLEESGPEGTNQAVPRKDLPKAIVIDWKKPVGAAIFLRAGHLWAVFDEADATVLEGLPAAPAAFAPGSFVPAEGATILRYPLREPALLSVSRTAEGQWRIAPTSSPSTPKALDLKRADGSTALRLGPASGKSVIHVVDPTVGDRLDVLPLSDPGRGQPAGQRFVDLEMLPTLQGLVWRPLNDRLTADIVDQSLVLSSPDGLALSSVSSDDSASEPIILKASARKALDPEESANERAAEPPAQLLEPTPTQELVHEKPASYFNLAGSAVERELVNEYRRIRRQAISKASPEHRDQARINLARLLVSERLGTEARTVLNAVSDDANADVMLQKQALSGVSALLIGHLADASSILLDPALSDDREIDIWRGALDSTEDEWQTAAEHWRAASEVLDAYPPRLKLDLGLMALEAAIETSDEKMITKGVRRLASLSLNPYDRARFDAMKALKAERSGDLERARTLLTGLTESPNPAIRTLAQFELSSLALETDARDSSALTRLDRRMPLWRGHPEERAMLDKLARRHVDANALRRALTVWRRLIRLYPDAVEDQRLKQARQAAFVQALTNEKEPRLDRLDVYAIYLDFIDLLPGDPEAREVQRHLARHLTELDLLDEAIDVLQTLMASSSRAVERADLAAEIAPLMLKLKRAAPALDILDTTETRNSNLPVMLAEQRQLLRARALAQLERTDDALRALRDLPTQAARRLRAEILWEERRWPRLAAAVESYFASAEPNPPLQESDQELVLWLALAREQENDTEELRALRERYGPAMQRGRYAEAFDVATQNDIETRNIKDFLAETGDQLAELQRFRKASPASP